MQTVSIRLLAGFAHWLKLGGYALLTVKASVPVLSFGLTLASAALSYTLLESPFLRLRKRFTVVANRPV
jgi:peptidoglycan/LPS O-acetylase OafA/YrhL